MNLFIVESPSKAETIKKYLDKDFSVIASIGHVRELVPKDGSVDIDNDFKMKFQIISKAQKQIKKITDLATKSDKIYLASDPDREGEAIAESLYEILIKKKVATPNQFYRITYTEVTKKAILEAFNNTRKIDYNLVDAQQSRLILDYLVGFNLSPVLWKKLPGSRSAGRVQSVALRMIVDREFEIKKFKPKEYWTINCKLNTIKKEKVDCRIIKFNDKDFDVNYPASEDIVESICNSIEKNKEFEAGKIKETLINKKPCAPFTTSLLQQEASKKLNFSAKKTMSVAQQLYEGGFITYLRTDGMTISDAAIKDIREQIKTQFGSKYLPKAPIKYKTKQKNAQEAHEAIRPTDIKNKPNDLKTKLNNDAFCLYELIWKRTMACQMNNALFARKSLDLKCNVNDANDTIIARVSGSKIEFDGYLVIYNDDDDDNKKTDEIIPDINEGDKLYLCDNSLKKQQHFTEPPSRFNEASLIKTLESYGIGRPSTYATIISILIDRSYVNLNKHCFFPTSKGIIVSVFLKQFFSNYVDYNFTAKLEENLDIISNGKLTKLSFLKDFWAPFNKNVQEVLKIDLKTIFEKLSETFMEYYLNNNKKCPKCDGILTLKNSKFGVFFGCVNYPKCNFTLNLDEAIEYKGEKSSSEICDNVVINHSKYGKIEIKKGKYGKYCEYKKDGKIKRSSLPNDIEITDKILDFYLSIPLKLGVDDDGNDIITSIGKYGPYISFTKNNEKKFISYKTKPYHEITLEKAVDLIKNSKKNFKKKK